MIELYVVQQFVKVARAGTLSEAAEALHVSQPALSRSMRLLERELGVPLFERTKNRLTLNDNGEYAARLAENLLSEADDFAEKTRAFARRRSTITLGVCSPGPVWRIAPLISALYPNMTLQTDMCEDTRLIRALSDGTYQLAVVHEEPADAGLYSKVCAHETIMFALPPGHRFARRKRLSFSEMNGEDMLLMPDIGFWNFVRDKMRDTHFLEQNSRYSFNALVRSSPLAFFTSDLAQKYIEVPPGRVNVPISDAESRVTYYLVCRKEDEPQFAALYAEL